MRFNRDDLLRTLIMVENYLIRNEKDSSKQAISNYYSLAYLFIDAFGIEIDSDIFMNVKKIKDIRFKNEINKINNIMNFSNENNYDLSILTNNFNSLLSDNIYNSVLANTLKTRVKMKVYSEKEFKDIIYSFFSLYGNDVLNSVKNIIDNNRVQVGTTRPIKCANAYTVCSYLTKDIYIITSANALNTECMSLIVHELGHALDMINIENNQAKKYYISTPFLEVQSCYFEMAFLDYLFKNYIDRESSLFLFVEKMLDNIVTFNKYSDLLVSTADYFALDINGKIVYCNSNTELINNNYRDDLIYFLGYITGLNMMGISSGNEKEYMKYLNNFSSFKHEQNFIDGIKTLGIDYEKYLECSLIENIVKDSCNEYIRKYTKYI